MTSTLAVTGRWISSMAIIPPLVADEWQEFTEEYSGTEKRTVAYNVVLADVANGDHTAGLFLSQLLYWFLPKSDGEPKTMWQFPNGLPCLKKRRSDWHDELRISPKQVDRALRILRSVGVIDFQTSTVHGWNNGHDIWINRPVLMDKIFQAKKAIDAQKEALKNGPSKSIRKV